MMTCPTAQTQTRTQMRAILARLVIDLETLERAADSAYAAGQGAVLSDVIGPLDATIDALNDYLNR